MFCRAQGYDLRVLSGADERCLALATTARLSHRKVLAVLVDPVPDHDVDDPQHTEVGSDASFRANTLSESPQGLAIRGQVQVLPVLPVIRWFLVTENSAPHEAVLDRDKIRSLGGQQLADLGRTHTGIRTA